MPRKYKYGQKLYMREYRSKNLYNIRKMLYDENEIYFEKNDRKRKLLIRSTPKWVDKDKIREIYKECIKLSEKYNMQFYVIHMIPISHRNVCGLHVHNNLKIVTENYKNNLGRKLIFRDY